MIEGERITSLSRTDDLPRVVDELQSETREGPCPEAIREDEVFLTGSLAQEQRWTAFASRAHEQTSVQSVLSLRLFAREDTIGALNHYSRREDAFDDHVVAVASIFAAHAAVALATAQREEQLERKAETRDIIGMAKGIIIAQEHVSDEEAFEILRRASRRTNVKLRELAEQLVHRSREGKPAEHDD